MKRLIIISIFIFSCSVMAQEPEFLYLEPKNVPGLSSEMVASLETDNCLVPKWRFKFGGMAKGQFAVTGQNDIAVICTKNGKSEIVVFWEGTMRCPSHIVSTGHFISVVDKQYILNHYGYYAGNKPPEITHEAINDHFVEKSSVVKYCNNGRWIELTGGD